MADVDDRGQLLLVGALTLAVMLVALAVLLNAAIYTGNVATRDAGPGTSAAIEYEAEATSMARSTIDSLNERENESYHNLQDNFTHTVGIWSETARVHTSVSLADASVETNATSQGTHIAQTMDREFTSDSNASNWTVANDSHVRAFRMNVTQDSLAAYPDEPIDNDSFRVVFDDGSSTGRVYLHQGDSENVSVTVVDPAGNETTCTVDPGGDGRTVIDLTAGTIGGQDCPEMGFFDQLSGTYNISYVAAINESGGEQVNGTYSLVVDRSLDRLDTGADGSGQPNATAALYSAELELTYRTANIYYQTELEIAPGEADD